MKIKLSRNGFYGYFDAANVLANYSNDNKLGVENFYN